MFIVALAHIDRGMGRAISLKDIPNLAFLTLYLRAQLPFVAGTGADKIPMVIYMVELVGHII